MSWLKDRWEEVTAQVKMGDNQTASTVRAARAKAAPATTRVNTNQPGWSVRKPQSAPLTTQQRVNQSYGPVGFSGFKNYLKDYVDNNTEADRIRRAATTGLNESYDQEQDRLTKQAQASNDKLGVVHQGMKSIPAGVAEFVGKTPGSIGQMQGRVAKTVNDINNPVLRTGAKALTAPFGGLMTDKQADYNIKFGQGLNSRVQNKLQQSAFGDRADDNKWVTGAGKMVGQLGGQIATGGLGTAAIGSQMAADEANKAQAAGKSNTYSTLTGLGQGGIGAISEKFGVDRFLPGNNVTGNTVTKLLKRGLTEGTQEVQQQFTQNLIANKAYNPEQGLKDGLAESFVMGGLAGGAMSPAVDIMNRPTAPKPTTSLVAPKPEPTRTRLRPEEARIWSDYQETLYKGNRMPAQVVNETHNKARQIADSLGVDIITGSPDEIAGRMNPLLEQSMAFQKEPTTNLVQRGKSELATGLNTINRGANQHTPYTQLVPTESGRQIVSPRDSGRVIRENFDEISEKTRARIQAAREKVPERFKLNKYGGSNADFDSPTIRNDLTGETIPNPAYRGKNVDPLESLKQEARKYKSAEEFTKAIQDGKVEIPKGSPETIAKLQKELGMNWDSAYKTPDGVANMQKKVIADLYNQAHSQPTAKPEAPQATAAKPDAETKFPGLVDDLMQANSTADVMAIYQKYGIPVDQGTADVTYRYKDNKNQLDAVTADMQTADEIRKASVVGTYTVKEQGDYLLSRDLPKRYIDGKNIPKYSGTESEFTVEIPKRGGDLVLVKNDKGTIFSETLDSAQSKYGTTDPELLANRMINGKKAEIVKKADPLDVPKEDLIIRNDGGKAMSIDPEADYIKKIRQPIEKELKDAQAEMDKYGTGYINDIDRAAQQAKAKFRLDRAKEADWQNSESRLRAKAKSDDDAFKYSLEQLRRAAQGVEYRNKSEPWYKAREEIKSNYITKFKNADDFVADFNTNEGVIPKDIKLAALGDKQYTSKEEMINTLTDFYNEAHSGKAMSVGKDPLESLKQEALKYGTEAEWIAAMHKKGYVDKDGFISDGNGGATNSSYLYDRAYKESGLDIPEPEQAIRNKSATEYRRTLDDFRKKTTVDFSKNIAGRKLQSLKEAAKQYTSPDEFIDSFGMTVHRGAPSGVPLSESVDTDFGAGYYFADASGAKNYASTPGREVQEYIVKMNNPFKIKNRDGINSAIDRYLDLKDSGATKADNFREYLKEKGYDGILVEDGSMERNGSDGRYMIVYDKSNIATRQQLTDLYNQATQPPKSTPVQKVEPEIPSYVPKDKVDAYLKSDDYLKDQRFKKMADETKSGDPFDHPDMYENPTPEIRKNLKAPQPTKGAIPERAQKVAEHAKQKAREVYEQTGDVTKAKEVHNKVIDKALIPVTENAPTYKATPKPPTPFEQNLQTAGLAPKKAKGLVVSETKPLNGQKIQKVRTAPGEVEQRVVQDRSDEIADTLGIRAEDRVPTTDSQRAERVDTAAQNGLENIKNNPEIVRQAAAPSTLKDKTKRKTFEEATKKYLGGTRSAEIERQATIASLNKEFKLSDKEKINAIISRDDPSVPALNEKVMRYNDRFKQLTDVAYKSYTDQGVKMGYVSSYLPRIYKNPETGQEVDLPEFKALIQGSKRMKGREAEKVAVDWLVEKDPTKLLERYYKSMDNAVAGRQYMKDLEDNGLVTASTEPVRGMRPVIAEGLQTDGKVFYAQKDVAHKLNELFGSKEATNLVEKTLEKGAGVNSLFQSFVLSGGVPNTPINAFGMMQLLKEGMALHPIKAGRAFFGGGLSKSYANKVFTAKKDVMKLMAENDLDIRVNLEQTGKWGSERIKDAFKNEGKAAGLNQAWNEFTNDATFGRFMPMLEVLHFENVYKHQLKGSLIRKPKSPAEAARIAADSTKNFYGKTSVYKTSTRSKAVDDAAGALLFAPRFRESMVNFWVKNAKTFVPTNTLKPEYRDNLKFMAASAAMYAAMTMLNEAMNGARMDENPDGKKDKLIMPASVAGKFGIDTKGKDIAVPFLPSIATVPRNLASLGANLATGKFNEAGKNAKAFASMPVKTVGDILTNEDYFGNKIVQDDSSPLQKFTQAASYVASSNMQPWIREALNAKGQKWDKETKKTWGIKEKSTFETLSNAGELPLRFYKPDTYRYGENWTPKGGKDEKFDFKQQRERAALGGEIKNISKTLKLNKRQDELFKSLSSVEFNDDGTLKEDNNPFYKSQRYTALQDDGVFEAMKQKSKLNAKLNGKPIDPIFSDDLAPDQRRVLLWKKTLPPGTSDPTVKKLYEQDWYQDYRNKESAYFEGKKAWNKKMGYKDATPNTNEYPIASKDVEDAQNAYFNLPKGGARTAFRKNNPDVWNKMIAFWDSKDAWTNGERSKLGLGAVDDEDSGGFSYGGKRSGKRGGRGSKGGSKYDYTKNLFDSGSDSASTSKQLRAILEKAMSGKS